MGVYEVEEEMDMPCVCACGRLFELNEGNACGYCSTIYCEECVPEPWELCEYCEANNA